MGLEKMTGNMLAAAEAANASMHRAVASGFTWPGDVRLLVLSCVLVADAKQLPELDHAMCITSPCAVMTEGGGWWFYLEAGWLTPVNYGFLPGQVFLLVLVCGVGGNC